MRLHGICMLDLNCALELKKKKTGAAFTLKVFHTVTLLYSVVSQHRMLIGFIGGNLFHL